MDADKDTINLGDPLVPASAGTSGRAIRYKSSLVPALAGTSLRAFRSYPYRGPTPDPSPPSADSAQALNLER